MKGVRVADVTDTVDARQSGCLAPRGHGCHTTVAQAMLAAGNARALNATHIGGARSLVHWYRDGGGNADYLRPDHHTLSVYLDGGHGVLATAKKRGYSPLSADRLMPGTS